MLLAASTLALTGFAQSGQDTSLKWLKNSTNVISYQLNKASKTYKPGQNPRSVNPDGTVRLAPYKD